jgi:formylglycine-generating enzyme
MGSTDDDPAARDNEKPAHRVRLDGFYIGEFVVTQDLWKAVTKEEDPSRFKGDRRPVECVSWDDIHEKFLPRLKTLTGHAYRLPTEAEWEYAARGGPHWDSEGYRYAGSDHLPQVGWYGENSGGETQEVGLLLPNALGLYDMSGNVWEWCSDWYDEKYYENFRNKTAENPRGPEKGEAAVLRGGSWNGIVDYCRVALRSRTQRDNRYDFIGFRLARAASAGGV